MDTKQFNKRIEQIGIEKLTIIVKAANIKNPKDLKQFLEQQIKKLNGLANVKSLTSEDLRNQMKKEQAGQFPKTIDFVPLPGRPKPEEMRPKLLKEAQELEVILKGVKDVFGV